MLKHRCPRCKVLRPFIESKDLRISRRPWHKVKGVWVCRSCMGGRNSLQEVAADRTQRRNLIARQHLFLTAIPEDPHLVECARDHFWEAEHVVFDLPAEERGSLLLDGSPTEIPVGLPVSTLPTKRNSERIYGHGKRKPAKGVCERYLKFSGRRILCEVRHDDQTKGWYNLTEIRPQQTS